MLTHNESEIRPYGRHHLFRQPRSCHPTGRLAFVSCQAAGLAEEDMLRIKGDAIRDEVA